MTSLGQSYAWCSAQAGSIGLDKLPKTSCVIHSYPLKVWSVSSICGGRVRARLQQNREVVGTDEAFFEDDGEDGNEIVVNLYNEQAGLLDDERDNDVESSISRLPDLEKRYHARPALREACS